MKMPPKGEKRKKQILDSAKEMFMTKGFKDSHIGQVCDELDIRRGTVYQYFSDKKDIIYTILNTAAESIEDILDPDDLKEFLKRKHDNKTILNFIDNRITSALNIFASDPIIIRLIYRDIAGNDVEVSKKVTMFLERITHVISKEIEVLRNNHIFKSEIQPDIASSMLIGGVTLIVYHYSNKNKDFLDKAVARAMSILYLHGVYEKLS